MSNTEQVLAWIHGIRGEPVAVLLENCDRDELIAYKDSLERSAILKDETLPSLPTPTEAAAILGLEPPEGSDTGSAAAGAAGGRAAGKQAKPGPAPDSAPTRPKAAAPAPKPAAAAAGPTSPSPGGDVEKERRGKALSQIAKLMKSAAEQLRNAPIERLEAFAANLEGNFRSLTQPDGPAAAAADPPPGRQKPGGQQPADPAQSATDGRSATHQRPSTVRPASAGRAPPNRPS